MSIEILLQCWNFESVKIIKNTVEWGLQYWGDQAIGICKNNKQHGEYLLGAAEFVQEGIW